MSNLQAFLQARGITEASPEEEQERAKAEYWRQHKRRYWHDEIKHRKKRVTVSFDLPEYDQVKREAKRHNLRVAPFIRACVAEKLNQIPIQPDLDRIRRWELGCTRAFNNLNQIARQVNRKRGASADIAEVIGLLDQLEAEVKAAFAPRDLRDEIRRAIERDTSIIEQIRSLLDQHLPNTAR